MSTTTWLPTSWQRMRTLLSSCCPRYTIPCLLGSYAIVPRLDLGQSRRRLTPALPHPDSLPPLASTCTSSSTRPSPSKRRPRKLSAASTPWQPNTPRPCASTACRCKRRASSKTTTLYSALPTFTTRPLNSASARCPVLPSCPCPATPAHPLPLPPLPDTFLFLCRKPVSTGT